jgi:F0F1-type ATP synthase assembly protein I
VTSAPQNIRAWSVGLDMVYSAAGMLLLGALIDWLAGTRPWWMLGLGLLGLVVGMYRFIRDAMRMNASANRPRPPAPRRDPDKTSSSADGPAPRDSD